MKAHRRDLIRLSVSSLAVGVGLVGCRAARSPGVDELRLATGPAGAVYRRIGGGLARVLAERLPELTVTAVPSRASTHNIGKLLSGEAQLGLSSLDAVVDAHGDPPVGISAICRVYDSHLHLVVPADSPIRSLADLSRRRVSFGARDSGTEFTATRLVRTAGLDVAAPRLDQASSAEALAAGRIDALFSLTGIPTPAIVDLAERTRIRLVPMPRAADDLATDFPGPYFPASIPATAYAGSTAATPTVAIPNVLLVSDALPRRLVTEVTDAVFTSASLLTDIPESRQINVRTGIATGPVPLHPGAADWFVDRKR